MGQIVKSQAPLMDSVKHYYDVIISKKWLVVGLFVLLTPLTYLGIQKSGKFDPGEQVSVQLGMHQPLQEERTREYQAAYLQKIELLKSRKFLIDVVKEMSLFMHLKDVPREEIFDSLKVDEFCIKGGYRFVIHNDFNRYSVLISNEEMGYNERTIRSGKLSQLSQISFPGFFAKFSPQFLETPFSFEFNLMSSQKALYYLLKDLEVNSPSLTNPSFRISLKGRDLKLITSTVNYIADHFIQQDILLRKQRTDQTVTLLEKQLQTAQQRREQSLQELNAYLSRNPDVALDQQLEQTVSDLSSLESNRVATSNVQIEANNLLKNYRQASSQDESRIVGEILDFLRTHEVATANFLLDEYRRVTENKSELEATYAPNHRLIRENLDKVIDIEQKAVGMLSKYIDKLSHEQSVDRRRISSLSQKVNSLPNKYTRLAELRGTHNTHSETYSSILSKYNEAKLATSVEVADFFIIDYAVQPLPMPEIVYYLKLLAISLGVGFMLAVGPIIVHENLKNTASSSFDLLKFRGSTLLEPLPNIAAFNKKGRKSDDVYPKIAALNQNMKSNAYVESMRSLSAKLLMNSTADKSYVLVSLEPSAGKSTVTANLAATMALRNMKTLVLDGDLRKGVQADIFSLGQKKGLSDILKSDAPITEEMIQEHIQPTKIENLFIMPCGGYEFNSFELMSSVRMKQIKNIVSSLYDVVLLDTPPLGVCADAVSISDYFSSYIPVVHAGKTSVPKLNKKLDEFPLLRKKVAGLVLNRVTVIDEGGYYYHYAYKKKKKELNPKLPKGVNGLLLGSRMHRNNEEKAGRSRDALEGQRERLRKEHFEKEKYIPPQEKPKAQIEVKLDKEKTENEFKPLKLKEERGESSPLVKHHRSMLTEIKNRKMARNKHLASLQDESNQVNDNQGGDRDKGDSDLPNKFKALLLK